MADRDIAIIGCAETKIVLRSGRHVYDLAGEAFAKALDHAGIDKSEIDGLAVSMPFSDAGNPFYSPILADYLGLELDWCQAMDLGGSSITGSISRAMAAIKMGMCETVMVVAADSQSSFNKGNIGAFRSEFQNPVGIMGPPGYFGLLSQRYDHQYGLDFNALAKLAVVQRNHALDNENACDKLQKPITEEDYFASPMISDPIRMLDCVMVCDGASAFVITSTRRAKELGAKHIVHPIGYGERINVACADQTPDITLVGHQAAGAKALKQAGMSVSDIQMIHPYDDFLIAVILQLEHLGFCEIGQGCDFVLDTDITYNGDLPINTGGGQISAGQAGLAGGGHNLAEALRQLYGEGAGRQTSGKSNAMVTGIGWIPYARNWGTSAVLILDAN